MKHPLLRDRLAALFVLLFRIALLYWLVLTYKMLLDDGYMWTYGTYRFSLRESLVYYTCQSNFLGILTVALSIPFSLLRVFGVKTPRIMEILQTIDAVNMLMLLLGYMLVYGATADWVFLNITQHALNPALVILDFILCVRPGAVKLWQLPLSFLPMGFYLCYTLFYLFPKRHLVLYPEVFTESTFRSPKGLLYILGELVMASLLTLIFYAIDRLKRKLFPCFSAPYRRKTTVKE